MNKTLTLASLAIVLSTAACSEMRNWNSGDATGATGTSSSTSSSAATQAGEVVAVPDPAGTASSGTGASSPLGRNNRETFSTGAGGG